MNRALWSVVLLAVVPSWFACGVGSPGGAMPAGLGRPLTLRLPPATGGPVPRFDEVAFRDGDLPWRMLDASQEFLEVEVTDAFGRYGVAVVWSSEPEVHAEVNFGTLAEQSTLDYSYSTVQPMRPASTRELRFSGLSSWGQLALAFGSQVQYLSSSAGGEFAPVGLTRGTADLVATVSRGPDLPPRALVRRGFTLGDDPVPTLDLADAVELRAVPLELSGALPGESASATTIFQAASVPTPLNPGTGLNLSEWMGAVGSAQLQVLPEALASPGDQYAGVITLSTRNRSRVVTAKFGAAVQPGTLVLPPLNPWVMEPGLDGHPRWRWEESAPDAWFDLQTTSAETSGAHALALHFSPSWLRGATEGTVGDTGATVLLDDCASRSNGKRSFVTSRSGEVPDTYWRIFDFPDL